jgi:hypothetical protein
MKKKLFMYAKVCAISSVSRILPIRLAQNTKICKRIFFYTNFFLEYIKFAMDTTEFDSESQMATRKRRIEMEDLSNVEFETSEEVEVLQSFDKMGLKRLINFINLCILLFSDLLRGIFSYGFEKPSAIQQRAIMQIIKVSVYLFI